MKNKKQGEAAEGSGAGEAGAYSRTLVAGRRARPATPAIEAAYLTHELRAPIAAMLLGLEILRDQIANRLQPEEAQTLSQAIKNTGRLQNLVNDIMDYTKLQAGKMKLDIAPVAAQDLLAQVVQSFRAWAQKSGITLVHELPDTPLPRFNADAQRIVQVLTNLISNALKFTPARGTVTVGVEVGRHEHAGTLLFRVKDTGRGIPADLMRELFNAFQANNQAHMAGRRQFPGTGLGLTIARYVVELHGGRIWGANCPDLGAIFCFTIPISNQEPI